jgi:hypothetical protein
VDDSRFDFTGLPAGRKSPFESLVAESVVLPAQLVDNKKRLHMAILRAWAKQHDLSVDAAWSIREACIAALSNGRLQKP